MRTVVICHHTGYNPVENVLKNDLYDFEELHRVSDLRYRLFNNKNCDHYDLNYQILAVIYPPHPYKRMSDVINDETLLEIINKKIKSENKIFLFSHDDRSKRSKPGLSNDELSSLMDMDNEDYEISGNIYSAAGHVKDSFKNLEYALITYEGEFRKSVFSSWTEHSREAGLFNVKYLPAIAILCHGYFYSLYFSKNSGNDIDPNDIKNLQAVLKKIGFEKSDSGLQPPRHITESNLNWSEKWSRVNKPSWWVRSLTKLDDSEDQTLGRQTLGRMIGNITTELDNHDFVEWKGENTKELFDEMIDINDDNRNELANRVTKAYREISRLLS